MRGSVKVAKGRIEEAAGVLIDDDTLRTKGKSDQVDGKIQQEGEKCVRNAKIVAHKIVDKAKSVAKEIVDKAQSLD